MKSTPLLPCLISLLLCLSPYWGEAQVPSEKPKQRFEKIDLLYHPQLKFQFVRRFPVKFQVELSENTQGISPSIMTKKARWAEKNLDIEVEQGKYSEGYIEIDPLAIQADGSVLTVNIRDRKFPQKRYRVQIPVPRLTEVKLFSNDSPFSLGKTSKVFVQLTYSDGFTRSLHSRWRPPLRTVYTHFPSLLDFEVKASHPFSSSQGYLSLSPTSTGPAQVSVSVKCRQDSLLGSHIQVPISFNSSQSFSFQAIGYGHHTPSVNVFVKKIIRDNIELLWVKAESPEATYSTIINPAVARVQINCRGRDGDKGSDGSDGSDGGSDPPTDGWSGDDGGDGEDGGRGGEVFIYTDVESEPFLDLIDIDNTGGIGGAGGSGGEGGTGGPGKCDGSDGSDGNNGSDGAEGPPIEIYYLPGNSLGAMIKNEKVIN